MTLSHLNLTSLRSRLSYGARIDPARDWSILLVLGGLVLVLVVVWNVWAFETVVNGGVLGNATVSSPPLFSQASLDTIQSLFSDRLVEETKYRDGTYRFADPSQ
jgi:hypothetical protein